eukprot:142639-Rhodomonas_salina.1
MVWQQQAQGTGAGQSWSLHSQVRLAISFCTHDTTSGSEMVFRAVVGIGLGMAIRSMPTSSRWIVGRGAWLWTWGVLTSER